MKLTYCGLLQNSNQHEGRPWIPTFVIRIFLIPFAKITKPFPKMSGCVVKRHKIAQTIKLKAEIQL